MLSTRLLEALQPLVKELLFTFNCWIRKPLFILTDCISSSSFGSQLLLLSLHLNIPVLHRGPATLSLRSQGVRHNGLSAINLEQRLVFFSLN